MSAVFCLQKNFAVVVICLIFARTPDFSVKYGVQLPILQENTEYNS